MCLSALITVYLLSSVLYFRNFPDSYIEGSGITSFKLVSEQAITLVLFLSLAIMYTKRQRFNREVFVLIAVSILLAALQELPFLVYSHMDVFPSFIGHLFKVLSYHFL